MLTLIQGMIIAIAIGNAEGNLNGLKPSESYLGHQDPCVAAGTCPDRKLNRGMFSITSEIYSPKVETDYFLKLLDTLNEINSQYNFTFWYLLNVADLYVQSPQATLGWNDSKSIGVGLLDRLRNTNPDTFTDARMAKTRTQAFENTDGVSEGWTSPAKLYKDQERRVAKLREIYDRFVR